MARTELSPVEDAERVLRRTAAFRSLGLDELDVQALARSEVTFHAVVSLLKKGCPLKLVARVLV